MVRGILLGSLLLLSILSASCDLKIEKIQHDEGRFSLVLSYDTACEVLVENKREKVVLFTKFRHMAERGEVEVKGRGSRVEALLALAKSKLGNSYQPAQAGPDHFDCSGFVYYVFKENGISIPRTSRIQSESGEKLDRASLKPGDILFFDTHARGHVNHSGIYLGDGKFIHSSSGKAYGVTISDLDKGFYKEKFQWGVRKVSR